VAGINSLIRVPPDSSGKAIATTQVVRGGTPVEFQEVLAAYQADCVSTAISVTTIAQVGIAANPARRGLVLQNLSDTRIIGRFDAVPVATTDAEVGFAIEPNGGAFTFIGLVDVGVLNVIHAGVGNKRLLITEWSA